MDLKQASDGVLLFGLGLAKKVLIADSVAPLVASIWAHDAPGFTASWLGGVAYLVQIYFDFSGYSDMAIGLGLLDVPMRCGPVIARGKAVLHDGQVGQRFDSSP